VTPRGLRRATVVTSTEDDAAWNAGIGPAPPLNHGVMGYRTPNIDRIAKEGAIVH